MTRLYGAIEAGGTKFVCAVGTGPEDLTEIRFPTTTPKQTLDQALAFFEPYKGQLTALGIGTFGPIELCQSSINYGCIKSTPKPHWSGTNLVDCFSTALRIPVALDTDVNAAALGEQRWGAAVNLSDFIYITICKGSGGGVIANNNLLHGQGHQ